MNKTARRLDIHLLWKSGFLTLFEEHGVKNIRTAAEYCRIYDRYMVYRNQGKNYTTSVELTAEELCMTEYKVRLAVAFCV